VNLGADNKTKVIAASVLGGIALLVVIYQLIPSSSTSASTPLPTATTERTSAPSPTRPATTHSGAPAKKVHAQSLDPTLNLKELAAAEQVKYEGSGRNIFVSQAEEIPKPIAPGHTDSNKQEQAGYKIPTPAPAPPIPLKFFGFASGPGQPRKIFLAKGDDVFIAGEGEIVDRRYKVLHISPTAVEIQDVVSSGPPQSLPLQQG
jgi:hypothetical protein